MGQLIIPWPMISKSQAISESEVDFHTDGEFYTTMAPRTVNLCYSKKREDDVHVKGGYQGTLEK